MAPTPLGTSFSPTASFQTPSPAHLFNTLQRAFDSGGRRIYATVAGAIQPGSKQCLGLDRHQTNRETHQSGVR